MVKTLKPDANYVDIMKYGNIYENKEPKLVKGDIFKIIIPLTIKGTGQATVPVATGQATGQVTPQATMQDERTKKIIIFCKTPRTREEIQLFLKLKDREYFRKKILIPLLEEGVLHPTIPDKLTSPNQKYYSNKSEKSV